MSPVRCHITSCAALLADQWEMHEHILRYHTTDPTEPTQQDTSPEVPRRDRQGTSGDRTLPLNSQITYATELTPPTSNQITPRSSQTTPTSNITSSTSNKTRNRQGGRRSLGEWKCPQEGCDRSYTKACLLGRHRNTHLPRPSGQSPPSLIGSNELPPPDSRAATPERKEGHGFKCDRCGDAFRKQRGLRMHEGWHKRKDNWDINKRLRGEAGEVAEEEPLGPPPILCPRRSELSAPEDEDSYGYQCDRCPDAFRNMRGLRRHEGWHNSRDNWGGDRRANGEEALGPPPFLGALCSEASRLTPTRISIPDLLNPSGGEASRSPSAPANSGRAPNLPGWSPHLCDYCGLDWPSEDAKMTHQCSCFFGLGLR